MALPKIAEPTRDTIDLGLLRKLWQASLSSTEQSDRHAIANLIGPVLLGAAASKLSQLQLAERQALRLLAGALKMLPGQSAATPSYPCPPSPCSIDCCVLIDDLAGAGWSSFLEQAVGLIPVKSISNVERFDSGPDSDSSLIELLNVDLNSGGRRLSLTGARREVVFLDLRLFADSRPTAEWRFLESLLTIAQTVREGTAGLAWPGIPQSDLDAVARLLIHRQREKEDYHIALSLLPRLLALADPCLPIVLFSSTTNRTILDLSLATTTSSSISKSRAILAALPPVLSKRRTNASSERLPKPAGGTRRESGTGCLPTPPDRNQTPMGVRW